MLKWALGPTVCGWQSTARLQGCSFGEGARPSEDPGSVPREGGPSVAGTVTWRPCPRSQHSTTHHCLNIFRFSSCGFLNGCACLLVFTQVPTSLQRSKILKPNLYHESKLVAREYQAAKACMFRAFIKAGLGAWVEKPTEQDQFSLTP